MKFLFASLRFTYFAILFTYILKLVSFSFLFVYTVQLVGSQFSDKGWNLWPLQWKFRILTLDCQGSPSIIILDVDSSQVCSDM